jgi:excisionase family DNA binding protein
MNALICGSLWGSDAVRRNKRNTAMKILNTTEAARYLSIGKRTLQEHVAAREITSIKLGRAIRFDMADLDAFIEGRKRKAIGWKSAR